MWCVYSFTGYFPIRTFQSIRTTQSKANKTFIDLWILFRFSSLHTQNFSTNKTLLLFLAFWSLVFHWTNRRHAIWWSLPRPWNGHNHVKKENKIGGARIYTAVKLLTVLYCHWLHFHLAQIGWASFFVCVCVSCFVSQFKSSIMIFGTKASSPTHSFSRRLFFVFGMFRSKNAVCVFFFLLFECVVLPFMHL